jgi:hypothetical protein
MIRRKLKILEFQNTNTKNFQNSYDERHIPSLLVKISHKKFEDPQNDKKKIKDFRTSNTKTKDLQSFQKKRKYPISPLAKLHTKNSKTPKMT